MGLSSGTAGWWHRLQPVGGLRPIQVDEDAVAQCREINELRRVFNGAVYANF
jgi:hypothetical protein